MLAAVALAGVARWLLGPVLGPTLPFFTFYFATVAAAWYGGFGPGVVSLALGIAAGSYFCDPDHPFALRGTYDQLDAFRFGVVGVAVSAMAEQLIRTRRRSERRRKFLKTTLACIGDAVITTDTEGRVTGMNGMAEALTGWTADEAAGRPLTTVFDIVNEHTRQPVDNPAVRALKDGVVVGLANHTVLIARDKTERPIDDSAAPIRGDGGRLYGCVLVFRDITERHRMENELRQVAAALSAADRRKDEFLATLAHELRNPLAPIRTGLQVMRLAGADAGAIERARSMMGRQLEHLVRLIDDLMDVSRISRGKIELRRALVPLAEAVGTAVEASRPLIDDMGHELTVTVPGHPVVIDADPTRLAQVFANLLNNAAKYSERGGHIWLTAERQGSDVVVSVRDTGIGIAADKLAGIFDLFSQVDRSLERARGGLGIGLHLVKRLVELHGGGIEARSGGPGRGSEFVVRLPVVVEASVPPPADGGARAAPKSSLRVLVVDDNQDGADSLAMMLKLMGHDTRTAYDGKRGVELAGEYRPDVALFDIGLPKLNGYEACRLIRQQPWGRNSVLIAVKGWGADGDRQLSRDAGFDHHLVKPVDPNTLMQLMAELSVAKQ
jgi:PAS domain S-box-containing protein